MLILNPLGCKVGDIALDHSTGGIDRAAVMAAPAALMVLGNSLLRQFDSSRDPHRRSGAALSGRARWAQVLVRFEASVCVRAQHSQTIAAISKCGSHRRPTSFRWPRDSPRDNGSALLSAVLSVTIRDLGAATPSPGCGPTPGCRRG